MKPSSVITSVLLGLSLSCGLPIRGEADAVPSVSFLTRISDVIVVGQGSLEASANGGTNLVIQLERIIKQEKETVPQTIIIPIPANEGACDTTPTDATINAIWFLRDVLGVLSFTSSPRSQFCNPLTNEYDVPIGTLASDWTYPPEASAADRLGYELAASIVAHQGVGPYALTLNPDLLRGISKEAANNIYSKMSDSQIEDIKLLGELGLVRIGNAVELQKITSGLAGYLGIKRPSSIYKGNALAKISYPDGYQTYEFLLAKSVASITNQQDAAVQELGKLLSQSKSQRIQLAAATALRNMHTPEALNYLGPLLSSNNSSLQDEAIAGMSCFANGVSAIDYSDPTKMSIDLSHPGPFTTNATLMHFAMGASTIRSRKAYFLDYWQQWWAQNANNVQRAIQSN